MYESTTGLPAASTIALSFAYCILTSRSLAHVPEYATVHKLLMTFLMSTDAFSANVAVFSTYRLFLKALSVNVRSKSPTTVDELPFPLRIYAFSALQLDTSILSFPVMAPEKSNPYR